MIGGRFLRFVQGVMELTFAFEKDFPFVLFVKVYCIVKIEFIYIYELKIDF